MTKHLITKSLLALSLSLPAFSGELRGVQMDEQMRYQSKTLLLNGMGLRLATFLRVPVYVAGLYVESKSKDPQALINAPGPKVLKTVFVRDVEQDSIRSTYRQAFADNCAAPCTALATRLDQFVNVLTAMKVGQELRLEIDGELTRVWIRGAEVTSINGADFGRTALSLVLGNRPPNPELKAGLLGQ